MLKKYFSTAIASLMNNRIHNMISISGYAIGLASCVLIFLFIRSESSYDKHWENSGSIFRLNYTLEFLSGGGPEKYSYTPLVTLPAFERYFANEIHSGTRLLPIPFVINVENVKTEETIHIVDSDIVDIFDFEIVAGDLNTTLANKNNIAISNELARNIFGQDNPIGKVLTVVSNGFGINRELRVSAVYRLPTDNSVIDLQAITLFDIQDYPWGVTWSTLATQNYIRLNENIQPESVQENLSEFLDATVNITELGAFSAETMPSEVAELELQAITDIYLNSQFESEVVGGSQSLISILTVTAMLILLIATINFTVLNTAQSITREKEVAVKKILGARPLHIATQHMLESMLMVLIAMSLAIGIAELVLPIFESMLGSSFGLDYGDPNFYFILIAMLLVTSFLSGMYPSFVLSNFHPARILKSTQSKESRGSVRFRNVLVLFQFGISIILIVASLVIYKQTQFLGSRELGFQRENLITVNNLRGTSTIMENKDIFIEEISKLPNVRQTSLSIHQPAQTRGFANNHRTYSSDNASSEGEYLATLSIDHNFFDIYDIPLLAGRYYSTLLDPIGVNEMKVVDRAIVNESAALSLGFSNAHDAVGEQISAYSTISQSQIAYTIVGVVANANFFNPRTMPRAEVYHLLPAFTEVLTISYEGSPEILINDLRNAWSDIMGDEVLTASFVDQLINDKFEREDLLTKFVASFSLLSVLIACMGLFSSASFTVQRRKKEIGIRKVLGAKVNQIVSLLVWQFSRPVLVANLLAWPVVIWIMLQWLEQYPYRIENWIVLLYCLAGGLSVIAISTLTIVSRATRAAIENPIDSIKQE